MAKAQRGQAAAMGHLPATAAGRSLPPGQRLQDNPKDWPDFSTASPTSPLSPSTHRCAVGTRTRREPCSRCRTVSPPIATTRLVISASSSGERRTTTSPREMRLSLALTLSRKTRSRISPLEQPLFWHGSGRISGGCTRGRKGLVAQRGSDGCRRTKVGCIERPLTWHSWL